MQSFPPDYVFYDSNKVKVRREIAAHIGNAVPVKLGYAIGISIKRHLEEVENGQKG